MSTDWSDVPAAVPYANLANPQTLNLYAMVADDPESFADLDGHCPEPNDPCKAQPGSLSSTSCTAESANTCSPAAPSPPPNQVATEKSSKQSENSKVLGVSSDSTTTKFFPSGNVVAERDIDYRIGTMENGRFEPDQTKSPGVITMDEKQTGGNDKPGLCSVSTCKETGAFEDNIYVSGPGKNFNTTQTFCIDGNKATIYAMKDGKMVSGS